MNKKLEISSDKEKLQLEVICDFLSQSYWANQRSRAEIETSIAHSDCFGAYLDGKQIGFVRILSDRTAFAYLMDVFIVPQEQGHGYAEALLKTVFEHEHYQNVKKWLLITQDAHSFYEKFDFRSLAFPERFMERGQF